jgi:UDP-2,3-diacylglucosamine pyrophosphatase LpxH
MIIVVSDLHLGYEKSAEKEFKEFVRNHVAQTLSSDDHFVLLGDIFDFWRKRNLDCMYKSDDILDAILHLETNVHYVIGNHDYVLYRIRKRYKRYNTFEIHKRLRLVAQGTTFYLTHGYELDVYANYEPLTIWEYEKLSEELCRTGNALGRVLGDLWGIRKKMKKPPQKRKHWKKDSESDMLPTRASDLNRLELFACSAGKNIFLGMDNKEYLIFGHTHRPFITTTTANTGSWVKTKPQEYDCYTYITIDNREISLCQWRDGKEIIRSTMSPMQ